MSERNIVGLDLGTTKIACIIGQITERDSLEIVGIGVAPSTGMKKGVVINIEKTAQSIREAVDEAEHMSGIKVEEAFTGIAGGHIKSENSRGVIAISRPEKEISQEDVDRVIEQAKAVSLPIDREIIHVIPKDFIVDNEGGVKEPVGMAGHKLEVDIHLISGAITSVQNIHKSVTRAGIDVKEIVLQPIASSYAILDPEEQELGVALVDIGGGTTDIALFYEGSIRDTFVISLGGQNITNDIAMGLRTSRHSAEEIKIKHGCAIASMTNRDELIPVPGITDTKLKEMSREILAEIIEARLEEIFTLVYKGIKETGICDLLSAGVVITGGSAKMKGIETLGEQIFGTSVRKGIPHGLGGLFETVKDPIHSTGVGLILYGLKHRTSQELKKVSSESLFNKLTDGIKKWFTE